MLFSVTVQKLHFKKSVNKLVGSITKNRSGFETLQNEAGTSESLSLAAVPTLDLKTEGGR